jgi:hypothetical protein
MPAYDRYHDEVRHALEKDGWTITDDPYTIDYKDVTVYADLGAEKFLAAEQGNRKIVVEIKSFVKKSLIQDLKDMLGSYDMYAGFLEVVDPERQLYMAISKVIYESFFAREAIQLIVKRYDLPFIIVDLTTQEIVKWTK